MKILLPLISLSCLPLALLACNGDDDQDHADGHGGEHSHDEDGHGGEHSHDEDGHGGEHSHDEDGSKACCELGAVCHVVGDDVDPEVDRCHMLGHANDGAACLEDYDECMALCEGLTADPMEHACE